MGTGVLSPRLKRPGPEASNSPTSSSWHGKAQLYLISHVISGAFGAKIVGKMRQSSSFTHPLGFFAWPYGINEHRAPWVPNFGLQVRLYWLSFFFFSLMLQADSEIIPHFRPRPLSCTLSSLVAIYLSYSNPCPPTRCRCRGLLLYLITLGRTPMDEWSARPRDLYLTTFRHQWHWRDSNPQSQQVNGLRPTP